MIKTFKIGGIHPQDNKLSKNNPLQTVGIAEQVIIPLSQHIGAPATPLVKAKDKVLTGQLIGAATGFISATVHSSVTGEVTKVDTYKDASGNIKQAIFIKAEPEDTWAEGILTEPMSQADVNQLSAKDIVDKVMMAGIVGLGGACFPTHVKLSPKDKIDTVIINGVECEPYLTHNHRLMLEKGREIILGTLLINKALGVEKAIICIENNKKDAIEMMNELCKNFPSVSVMAMKMKYPQGGEKQLIDAALKRRVKSGQLPASEGVVVQNVSTAFAIYEAVYMNKPLIEVMLTVTGKQVANPANYIARIGTPMTKLIELSGGVPENTGKVVIGGPLMGKAAVSVDIPVSKQTSGVLFLNEKEAAFKAESPCIRCGKCVGTCPMGLEPYLLASQAELKLWDEMEEHHIMDCIECGCCTFTCPSQRRLLDYVHLGKATVANIIRERKQ